MKRIARAERSRPLRERLLAHGRRQIGQSGVRALSLRGITAAAGVTPMAAYRHFKNKEALLAALAAEGLHAFAGSLRSASRAADPRTRLFDVCKAYLRFSRDHRADFELIFGAAIGNRKRYPELYEAGGEAFAVLTGVVADCQKAKVLDARRDTIACAANLWVHIHGLCSLSPNWRTSDRIRAPKKPDALVETFMGDLLDGLGGHAR